MTGGEGEQGGIGEELKEPFKEALLTRGFLGIRNLETKVGVQ